MKPYILTSMLTSTTLLLTPALSMDDAMNQENKKPVSLQNILKNIDPVCLERAKKKAIIEGMEQGIEQGIKQKTKTIVFKMLKKNETDANICDYAEITPDQLTHLKQELAASQHSADHQESSPKS